MPATTQQPSGPTPQQRHEHVVKLAIHLFRNMCAEQEIALAQRYSVLPSYFLGWANQHYVPDPGLLCAELDIPADTWGLWQQLIDSVAGVERVWKIWPLVCLCDRPEPQQPLASIHVALVFKWPDGTIMPISFQTNKDMLGHGVFTDGLLWANLREQFENILTRLAERGLDSFYQQGDQYGGDYPYEVMMGMLLKGKQHIKPELRPYYDRYLRLAQYLIRPPLPPQVVAQIEERKRLAQLPQDVEPPVRGGWD